jgi:hypothetical protein
MTEPLAPSPPSGLLLLASGENAWLFVGQVLKTRPVSLLVAV